jgi:hypothetical protein
MTRRPNVWQRVLALAPLLLVIVSLPTQVLVRCRMDGQVRERCCCPADENPSSPALQAPDCCDREVSTHSVPTARNAPETSWAPVVLATSIPHSDRPALDRGVARVLRESCPARGGPPIRLITQTFLI